MNPTTHDPYWNLEIDRRSWVLLLFGATCCVLLHLTPVLQSPISLPLTAAMAFGCFLSPTSGFFFLGCNQFLPFREGSINPAEIGAFAWLLACVLRYGKLDLSYYHHFLWVVPWLVWHSLMTGENIFHIRSEYSKALIYAAIGLQQANMAKGEYLKCLFGLSVGTLMVGVAYWCNYLGLPIQISDWGGEREGFTRMGGARADSVLVWPALMMGLGGILGLAGLFATPGAKRNPPQWLLPTLFITVFLTLPPMVATMSHGAFVGLGIIFVWFIVLFTSALNRRESTSIYTGKMKTALMIAVFLAFGMYTLDAFHIRSRTEAIGEHFEKQSDEMGVAASRTDVWLDAIDTIIRYPLTGVRFAGGTERITSQYYASGSYLAHNVFLDYGRTGGLPGLLFVTIFFFIPSIRLWRNPERFRYIPFLMVFIGALTFWLSLSFQFYKTIWALWPLMMRTADPD